MVWDDVFTQYSRLLKKGNAVSITGRLSLRGETLRFSAKEIKPLGSTKSGAPVRLVFPLDSIREADLLEVRERVKRHPGLRALELEFVSGDGERLRVLAGEAYSVDLCPELREELSPWLRG